MSDLRPVGIDLGTTNSCIATIDSSGRTKMVRNSEGDLLTPSAVLFDAAEVTVGKEAHKVAAIRSGQVAEWIKRDMGNPVYSRPIRGQYLPPEVIQACILRKLKADAVAALGPDVKAVITVPAYFDEPRRKSTADAGEMAGLAVMDIVNEPTAAALAFGEALGYLVSGTPRDVMTVAVYDLGGGTFDATLLRLAPGDLRTLATDGDVHLGGFDWDLRLLNHAADWFHNAFGVDPRDDPSSWQRLYDNVVDAKHTLSVRTHATVRVEHAGHSAELEVTRDQFQSLTADLLERTAYTTRQLLAAAKLSWSDVNRVLLVGGSTRMPMVTRMLRELTGLIPDRTVNPDEAVARGAAIYANYLLAREAVGPQRTEFRVTDVNAHSLGVEGLDPETLRKTNVILIRRNTPLPASFTHRFMTKIANQRSIVVQVLEGESTLPGECNAIGRTVIRDLPAGLTKGWPIDVTFEYATNGRLNVRAAVPGTDRQVTLDLEREHALTSEGLVRWKQAVCQSGGFDAFEAMLDSVLGPMGAPGDSAAPPVLGAPLVAPVPSPSVPGAARLPAEPPRVLPDLPAEPPPVAARRPGESRVAAASRPAAPAREGAGFPTGSLLSLAGFPDEPPAAAGRSPAIDHEPREQRLFPGVPPSAEPTVAPAPSAPPVATVPSSEFVCIEPAPAGPDAPRQPDRLPTALVRASGFGRADDESRPEGGPANVAFPAANETSPSGHGQLRAALGFFGFVVSGILGLGAAYVCYVILHWLWPHIRLWP
jgi:molecular chaperone DnaK